MEKSLDTRYLDVALASHSAISLTSDFAWQAEDLQCAVAVC